MTRTGWHLRAGAVVVAWLVALLVVALAHRYFPVSRWLMVHLLVLGAVTNAILVWSSHFAAALLRLPEPATRRAEAGRLVVLNAGAVTVVAGVVSGRWPLVLVGGTAVALAVLWHVVSLLRRMRASLPSRFRHTLRYYVAAGLLLVVGVTFGVTMTHNGISELWFGRLVVAHALTNLLGWIALTIIGTLVTLWPTMLRTRIVDGAEVVARRVLPVLVGSLTVAVAGALAGMRVVVAAGLLGYLAGVVLWCRPALAEARVRPPTSFATLSVVVAPLWLIGSLATLVVTLLVTDDPAQVVSRAGWLTTPVLAGFVLPVLLGALSYLVPVVIGGGPNVVRTTTAVLDRGAVLRVATANLALLVCVLPVPSLVRVSCSVVLLVAYAAFLPLLVRAVLVGRRRTDGADGTAVAGEGRPTPYRPVPRSGSAGAAARHGGLRSRGGAAGHRRRGRRGPTRRGPVHGVRDRGRRRRRHPDRAYDDGRGRRPGHALPPGHRAGPGRRPAGDRADEHRTTRSHDLALETGVQTPLLAPGEQARLEVGVVGRDLAGWCTVAGHRQMGMVLAIEVTGAAAVAGLREPGPSHDMADMPGMGGTAGGPSAADGMDLMADPGPGFAPYDAALPPAPAARVHQVTLVVQETVQEVAPGVTQTPLDVRRHRARPDAARQGRRRLRDHAGQRRHDRALDRLPRRRAGAGPPDAHDRARGSADVPVHRHPQRDLDVPLLDDADVVAHRERHVRRGRHRPARTSRPSTASTCWCSPSSTSARRASPPTRPGSRPSARTWWCSTATPTSTTTAPLRARVGERVRIWVLDAGPDRQQRVPRRRRPVRHGVPGGRVPAATRRGRHRRQPGARAVPGAGRVRGADVPRGRALPVRVPRHGRRRARRPRHHPRHGAVVSLINASAT